MVQYKKNGKEAPARSTSTPKKRLMAVNPSPNNIPASRTNIAGQICGKDAHYGIFIITCKYQRPATVRMITTPNVQIHDITGIVPTYTKKDGRQCRPSYNMIS